MYNLVGNKNNKCAKKYVKKKKTEDIFLTLYVIDITGFPSIPKFWNWISFRNRPILIVTIFTRKRASSRYTDTQIVELNLVFKPHERALLNLYNTMGNTEQSLPWHLQLTDRTRDNSVLRDSGTWSLTVPASNLELCILLSSIFRQNKLAWTFRNGWNCRFVQFLRFLRAKQKSL